MENKESKRALSKKGLIILVFVLLGALIAAFMWWHNYEKYIVTDDANLASNRISIASMVMGPILNQYVTAGDTVAAGDLLADLDSAVIVSQLEILLAQQKDKKASATIEVIKAKIKALQTQLTYYKIKAPRSGVIAKCWMLAGDIVQPAQTLFTLDANHKLWLAIYLEETKYSMIAMGQTVKYVLDAYPSLTFWGKIYYIGTNTASQFSMIPASNASGNFTKVTQRIPIKISIDRITGDPERIKQVRLASGMSAEVKIVK